jgi:hypothetical protein
MPHDAPIGLDSTEIVIADASPASVGADLRLLTATGRL